MAKFDVVHGLNGRERAFSRRGHFTNRRISSNDLSCHLANCRISQSAQIRRLVVALFRHLTGDAFSVFHHSTRERTLHLPYFDAALSRHFNSPYFVTLRKSPSPFARLPTLASIMPRSRKIRRGRQPPWAFEMNTERPQLSTPYVEPSD